MVTSSQLRASLLCSFVCLASFSFLKARQVIESSPATKHERRGSTAYRQAAQINESQITVQLKFEKGKITVDERNMKLAMSVLFCKNTKCTPNSDGSLTLTDKKLIAKLLKKLKYSLSTLPSFDEIALSGLYDFPKPVAPTKPDGDASPEAQTEYDLALAAYKSRIDELQKSEASVRAAVTAIPLTTKLRRFSGCWNDVFRLGDDDPSKDGLFQRWRVAVLAAAEVPKTYCDLCATVASCNDNEPEFCTRCETCNSGEIETPVADREGAFNTAFTGLLGNGLFVDEPLSVTDDGFVSIRIRDPIPRTRPLPEDPLAYTIEPRNEEEFVKYALTEAGLLGSFWSQEEIASAVRTFYEARGYTVNVLADDNDGVRFIRVQRLRLEYVKIPNLANNRTELFRVLRKVLPTKAFDEFVASTKSADTPRYLECSTGGPLAACTIYIKLDGDDDIFEDIKSLAVSEHFIFANQAVLTSIESGLRNIDYQADVGKGRASKTDRYLKSNLSVAKVGGKTDTTNAEAESSDSPIPTVDPTPAPSSSSSPSRSKLELGVKSFRKAIDHIFEPTLYQVCPPNNNRFYGGIDYRPSQGLRLVGGYKCLKLGPGSAGFEIGSDGELLGKASYSQTFTIFKFGERDYPTTIGFDVYSDFERHRILGSIPTDERRNGGTVSLIQPLFLSVDSKIRGEVTVQFKRETVSLTPLAAASDARQNLTTFSSGFRFSFRDDTSLRATRFEIYPRIKFDPGISVSEPKFATFAVSSAFHRELTYAFDGDLKGRIEWASSQTPVFEQPTFGGESFVRGFRKDDAIGRGVWSVQSEMWLRMRAVIPPAFSYSDGAQDKLRGLIRESVSLAFFYDIGGARHTTFSQAGTRSAVGVGLRFNYNKAAIFKLDWARGFGPSVEARSSGRFYFSIEIPDTP